MQIDTRVGNETELRHYLLHRINLDLRPLNVTDLPSAIPLIYAAEEDYFELLFGSRPAALEQLSLWAARPNSEYAISRAIGLVERNEAQECAGLVIALSGQARHECRKANIVGLLESRAFLGRWRSVGYEALRDPLPAVPHEVYYIRILSVSPAWRRLHLGRELMQIALENGLRLGYTDFRVDLRADNIAARRLYEGMGFETIAQATNPLTHWSMLAMVL